MNAKGIQYHGFVRRPDQVRMAPAATLRPVSGGGAALVALPGGRA